MNRRALLRGLFAAPAIVAASSLMPVKAALLLPPKLWGDGVHDDTAAFQAMLDAAQKSGKPLFLRGGQSYRITSTLHVNSIVHIDGATFVADGKMDAMLRFNDGAGGSSLRECMIDARKADMDCAIWLPAA